MEEFGILLSPAGRVCGKLIPYKKKKGPDTGGIEKVLKKKIVQKWSSFLRRRELEEGPFFLKQIIPYAIYLKTRTHFYLFKRNIPGRQKKKITQ